MLRTLLAALACTLAITGAAWAQSDAKPPEPPPPPKKLESIEVSAPDATQERRESTAAKIVVNRDEILRYGDTTILDVMKRLPGVSVGGSGRASDIRLRGLGSGYTRILVNGELMPPGFSIETLSPELIERIEIIRGAMAEFSTQSIAGTINIVLRQAVSSRQREAKLGLATENGALSVNTTAQVSDKSGAFSYTLPINVNQFKFRNGMHAEQTGTDAAGMANLDYVTDQANSGTASNISFSPRLSWEISKGNTLASENFVLANHFRGQFEEASTTFLGTPPQYASSRNDYTSDRASARTNLTWTRQLAGEARIEAKLGLTINRRTTRALFDAFDAADVFILERTVRGHTRDDGVTTTGKYVLPYLEGHALATGWDAGRSRRYDDRLQRDVTPTGLPQFNIDESYDAIVDRLALYAQDEWQVTQRVSLYVGLRWEGLETRTVGNVVSEVHNRSSVLSPIVQGLWKLPGTEKDQLRAGLARTYKAPDTGELVPRRYVANNNTATTPDYQGNPNLRPELAWGLDGAYEHYFTGGGIFSVSVYQRRIDDVILRDLVNVNGTFISQPANVGRASTRGIEVDTKIGLKNFVATAPALDLRANVARNWSRVEALPGPDNRLDRQARITGNVGLDYKAVIIPLTMGGSFTFTTGGRIQESLTQSTYSVPRRNLDFYALWKFSPSLQLRLTASNVLAQDALGVDRYSAGDGTLQIASRTPAHMRAGAVIELRL